VNVKLFHSLFFFLMIVLIKRNGMLLVVAVGEVGGICSHLPRFQGRWERFLQLIWFLPT
jgi:hypothetical protein